MPPRHETTYNALVVVRRRGGSGLGGRLSVVVVDVLALGVGIGEFLDVDVGVDLHGIVTVIAAAADRRGGGGGHGFVELAVGRHGGVVSGDGQQLAEERRRRWWETRRRRGRCVGVDKGFYERQSRQPSSDLVRTRAPGQRRSSSLAMANSDPTVPLPSSYLPSIHTGLFSSWPSSAALAPTHAQGTASQSINSSSRTNDFGGEYGDHQPTRPLHPCWELPVGHAICHQLERFHPHSRPAACAGPGRAFSSGRHRCQRPRARRQVVTAPSHVTSACHMSHPLLAHDQRSS